MTRAFPVLPRFYRHLTHTHPTPHPRDKTLFRMKKCEPSSAWPYGRLGARNALGPFLIQQSKYPVSCPFGCEMLMSQVGCQVALGRPRWCRRGPGSNVALASTQERSPELRIPPLSSSPSSSLSLPFHIPKCIRKANPLSLYLPSALWRKITPLIFIPHKQEKD